MIRTILPPRPVAPGVYPGRIDAAQLIAYQWRSTKANPDGLAAKIVVAIEADDGPAHVVDAIDITNPTRLAQAFASCGLSAPTSIADLEQLIGQPCRIVTKNITPCHGLQRGQQKACVSGWVAVEPLQ